MSDLDLDGLEADLSIRPSSQKEALIRIQRLSDAASTLIAAARREELRNRREGTHAPDCHLWGPRHYDCLLKEYASLRALLDKAEKALEPFATFGKSDDDANLTVEGLVRDRICDWFGVSDFAQANAVLSEIRKSQGARVMPETILTADEVRDRLRAACEAAGSLSAWARSNGVSKQLLSQILSGRNAPSQAIMRPLGLTMKKILMYEYEIDKDRECALDKKKPRRL